MIAAKMRLQVGLHSTIVVVDPVTGTALEEDVEIKAGSSVIIKRVPLESPAASNLDAGKKVTLPLQPQLLPSSVIFNEKLTSTSLIMVFWTAKMKEGSRDMKGFAEQYYWNHSASCRFLNVMDHNFSQQMAIPEKFVKNFNEDLVGSFVLKGPSGNVWLVKLQKVGDDLQFKDGWKEFVESHHIGEGDILTFEYEGNSCFNVLIYDASGCEREMSYLNHKNVLADEAHFSKKHSAEYSAENIQKTQPPNNYQSHEEYSPLTMNGLIEGEKLERECPRFIQ